MYDAQEGQLDPLRVLIATDSDGRQLIERHMLLGYKCDDLF